MAPSVTSHDTRRRDALSIDALVERPSTRQCGKCQEAQTRCDGREPCRNCEVRGTLCGYAWSSFSAPHTLPPVQVGSHHHHAGQYFPPATAKRRSPVPTGSIFPRSNALDGGWAIVPQGTNAPTAHAPGPVLSCKTCLARNTPCDGVTPVCGSCRIRRLECYLATPAPSNSDRRNGNGPTMTWSARDRQALNPRSFPPSLSQAAMLLPPSTRPRAPSDVSKPTSSRASLSFMLNPKPDGKVASGSKTNSQRPADLKQITTVTTPTHHVTPPTPVAPSAMEKAQAMDVDHPTSPGSSSTGANLSRRTSRKRSASPESHYARDQDSPSRESVSSLGLSALAMGERRNRALSHAHSPRSSMDSHPGRHMEAHSPRNSIDSHPSSRNALDARSRGSIDSSHSPTRSTRNSLGGPPLDEVRGHNPVDPHSHRPVDSHSSRPVDSHPLDAHRRSLDQPSLASPMDPNRPRSQSKSSLSHLLDGGGYGGMSSKSPIHTHSTSPKQHTPHTSPIHTTHRTDTTPPHTARPPPRTPSSEFGPSPTAHGPGPSPKAFGPGHSPTASKSSSSHYGPGPSPTSTFGPARSPTASTSASEPFSRPMSAESFTHVHRDIPIHPAHKQTSISTALHDMQLKSTGTSRASSPGGHRDVFVHSAFNGANPHPSANPAPRWTTFGAAGENIKEGRMANVWRHETEAGMRRREAEAELRKQDQVELHRRRSEGGIKRRKLGEEEGEERERRMSIVSEERKMSIEERRMSIVSEERRMSIVEPDPDPEPDAQPTERRMSIVEPDDRPGAEPEKRMSGIEPERKSIPEVEHPMSILEQLRRATGSATKGASSLPVPRNPTVDVFRSRRESAPVPVRWTDDKSKSPIVINDSPEVGIGDADMDLPEQSEKLFPGTDKPGPGAEKLGPGAEKLAPGTEKLGPGTESDGGPPLGPFGHIWPPPVIESGKKGGRRSKDLEPVPARSFITPLNLAPAAPAAQVKQPTPVVDDEPRDKEAGSSQLSSLRSMLTTMPPPTAFGTALQEFTSAPASKLRRNRAIIMTKTLMKDILNVLLDPATDEMLKDYVPPEKKKDDDRPDGTRRKMSIAIDTPDHGSLEFRAWAKRMFSTIKTNQDKDVLAFDGKPVVVEDDIYTTIMICHSQGNHCGVEETAKLVDQEHSWVPRVLVEAFVQKCPGCPLENKMTSTTSKPKKRKSVRGTGPRRITTTRRGKKTTEGEAIRRSRKSGGKEASADDSDPDEGDQEEDELKESGDEAGPADVKTDPDPEPAGEDHDQDQDELEADADEPDEAEEPEMESEDEQVSRPSDERKNT